MLITMNPRYLIVILVVLSLAPAMSSAYYAGDIDVTTEVSQVCPCDIISGSEITVEVKNFGTKSDTFYITMEIPQGWSGFVEPEVTLSSGEEVTLNPSWVTPPCGTLPGTYTLSFYAESAMSGKVSEEHIEIEVMTCHAVDITGGPFSTCEETEKQATVSISNAGNMKDTFFVSASPKWVTVEPKEIVLDEFESKSVTIKAKPPEGVFGAQNVTIKALSENTYAMTEEIIGLDVQRCHYFGVSIIPPEKSVCLGDAVDYQLTIDNKGTVNDKYVIVAPAWTELSANNVSVSAKGRKIITLTAVPVSPGQKRMDVYVSSANYPTNIVKAESIVTVNDCRDASVEVKPGKRSVCRGDGTAFTLSLNNTGNTNTVYDVYMSVGEISSKESIMLNPHEVQDMDIGVDAISKAGVYHVSAIAYVGNRRVASGVSELVVSNCYEASMKLPTLSEADLCRGDTIVYDVFVQNDGEKSDAYVLSYRGGEAEFMLGPGRNVTIETEIEIESDWGSTGHLYFDLESDNGVSLTDSVRFNVSEKDQCHSVDVIVSGADLSGGVKTAKGYGIPVEVTVKNTGIRTGSYVLSLGGPEWAYITADSATIGPGGEEKVYVYLSPPYDIGEDDYSMIVLAESENAFASAEINASVLSELSEAGSIDVPSDGFTGMFGAGSPIPVGVLVASILASLTAIIVLMRFVLFK